MQNKYNHRLTLSNKQHTLVHNNYTTCVNINILSRESVVLKYRDTRAETWGVLMYKMVLSDVDIKRIEIATFFMFVYFFFYY